MNTHLASDLAPVQVSTNIGVILTGGTVGTVRSPDGILRVDDGNERLPVLENTSIHILQPLNTLSENMRPADWVLIARAITTLVDNHQVSGVVVLHGTDTMGYTSAALSFLLAGLNIPVVLTGSNISPSEPNSDAETNISDALRAAKALPSGVFVSFSGIAHQSSIIHLGSRVRKGRAEARAFTSIGTKQIGEVKDGQVILGLEPPLTNPPKNAKCQVDDNVLLFTLYPGCHLDAIAKLVESQNYAGVVLELYPSATGPELSDALSLEGFTQTCVDAGIVVVGVVREGLPPSCGPYESTRRFTNAGGLLLGNILPETALVKVMWALGQANSREGVLEILATEVAGEFY